MKKITVKELLDLGIIDVYDLEYFDVMDKAGRWTKYQDEKLLVRGEFDNYEVTCIYPSSYEGLMRMDIKEN